MLSLQFITFPRVFQEAKTAKKHVARAIFAVTIVNPDTERVKNEKYISHPINNIFFSKVLEVPRDFFQEVPWRVRAAPAYSNQYFLHTILSTTRVYD